MNFLARIAKRKIDIIKIPIDTVYINNNRGSHFNPLRDSFIIFFKLFVHCFDTIALFLIDLCSFIILSSFIFTNSNNHDLFMSAIISKFFSMILNIFINKPFVYFKKTQFIKLFILFFSQIIISSTLISLFASGIISPLIIKFIIDGVMFVLSNITQKRFIFH